MKTAKFTSHLLAHRGLLVLLCFHLAATVLAQEKMPLQHFDYVEKCVPHSILDIRYFGTNNFLGKQVDGYGAPKAILSHTAIKALKKAATDFFKEGYGIKVFDTYRPQRAVDHFVKWALDKADTLNKDLFYPDIDKKLLFKQGYIAKRSGHSRGSTIDLTLYELSSGEEIDMGSSFDFFGPISGHGSSAITETQKANRMLLRRIMEKNGFKAYEEEWWHYTLRQEPFPETYFDFPIR